MKTDLVQNWIEDLGKEKGFVDVVRVSWSVVGNWGDVYATVGVFIIGSAGSGLVAAWRPEYLDLSAASKLLQTWATMGVGMATSILGFLIAGFAIFATMTSRDTFVVLAKVRKRQRSISEFKFVFFNFLYVFAHYIIYLLISIFVIALCSEESVVPNAVELYEAPAPGVLALGAVICTAFASYSLHMILILRGFIWNMYQSLLFAIFFDGQN